MMMCGSAWSLAPLAHQWRFEYDDGPRAGMPREVKNECTTNKFAQSGDPGRHWLGIVNPASGDTNGWVTTRQTFPVDAFVINSCNRDEPVHIIGTAYILVNTKIQNGTFLVREIDLLGGTGTGTGGSKYVFGEGGKINISTGANSHRREWKRNHGHF
jgi:hypothetical protein